VIEQATKHGQATSMPLRIATWNVNSVRQRIGHLQRFCAAQQPDVLCLQETKVTDEDFPAEPLRALGYRHQLLRGQKSYNGVAILSRLPFAAEGAKVWCRKNDCRHLEVHLPGGIELHNFYVPSGGDTPDPEINDKFAHKLRFLREMARWCRDQRLAERKAVLVGDLNVAPLETDVWNHKRLLRSVGHTPVESDLMARLHKAGTLIDVPRHFVPPDEPLYTWWGYRFPQSFAKNYGWRLDHALATPPALAEIAAMTVFKDSRTWDKPSDHVPVVIDFA
jgi:exodeoxyribonuclease-3